VDGRREHEAATAPEELARSPCDTEYLGRNDTSATPMVDLFRGGIL
jgi:hypothetical protein